MRAQEERERQAREAKAKEERREEEREVEAQGRHEEGGEKTMQQDCVEGKEVDQIQCMTKMTCRTDTGRGGETAWWIRVVNGPHLRTAPSLCSKPGGFPHVIFTCPVSFSPFASSSLSPLLADFRQQQSQQRRSAQRQGSNATERQQTAAAAATEKAGPTRLATATATCDCCMTSSGSFTPCWRTWRTLRCWTPRQCTTPDS